MKSWICSFVVLFALALSGVTARRCPLLHASETANKTGCYIISVAKDTTPEKFQEILQLVISVADGNKVYGVTEHVTKAITVKLSDYSLAILRETEGIQFIEEETMARGAQTLLPYHLDRLDQRGLPLDGAYNPIGDGEGVDIYIFDSGIYYNHEEFENRAKYAGFDPMDDYLSESRLGADCFGHGTHVASNAVGVTYGAAKKATVYSVRVLDCTNFGPWSVTLAGLDYVMDIIPARGRPAIVSMSLSGGYTQSVNDAVQSLYNSGIPVVVAAGNSASDACAETPASAPDVITVAGSANNDGLYFSTNYGSCVDIFAPGDRVSGADYLCPDCFQFLSGTSFSTPIVSGIIAILLQRKPLLTPDQIIAELTSSAINNALDFRQIPSNFQSSTPNRAVYIPGNCGGEISIGLQSSTALQSPNYPSNYPESIKCKWVITGPSNSRVRISFSSFTTESGYDTVEVCSARFCEESTSLATLSGQLDSSMRVHSSSSNILTIELKTDGRVGAAGFQGTVDAIEIPTDSTTQPSTTAPTSPVDVTCPTVPPPVPNCTISNILSETLSQAELLLDAAIGDTLENLLQIKLEELDEEPPTNVVTTPTTATRPPDTTTMTTQPPTTQEPTLDNTCLGCSESNPAYYCQEIARNNSGATSGYYWVQGRWGVEQVYCDMSERFQNTAGWMRVASLNMGDFNQDCPSGLRLIQSPVRTCGRGIRNPGCSSVYYSTVGVAYSRICGRVIGYQFSSPNAFFAHQYDPDITIDEYYLDGISITRGTPRQHIWSFAATLDELDRDRHICPCTHSGHTLPSTALPEFIGEDYFCDSGTPVYQPNVFHSVDPLWDGQGCGPESTCCNFNTPPWFCKDLVTSSLADLELRICGNENTDNEDTPIEIVELYHCRNLKEFHFAGPNENVTLSDMMTVGNLNKLEVLCVDLQAMFEDETLKILGRECPCIRTLSCAACYGVSDSGIACLLSCPQLSDINLSYCNKVTDIGLCKVLHSGMRRICMRACQMISDTSIVKIASVCLMLQELDVSGCLGVSSECLTQLLHLILSRDKSKAFDLLAGGSGIDEDAAIKFAEASDVITVNLRDFSLPSLSADYDPYLFIPPLVPSDDQESDEEGEGIDGLVHLSNDTGHLETHRDDDNHLHQLQDRDFLLEQAEDFLIADDPAMFSDEFSDPEEWGFT